MGKSLKLFSHKRPYHKKKKKLKRIKRTKNPKRKIPKLFASNLILIYFFLFPVDRSIYELDFVPFRRLENISLQKCEFSRQVTILSVVIWPSVLQFNLVGNRLFDQTSHPGNVKAIMKFFKKAGVTIVTGYHFTSKISDEVLQSEIISYLCQYHYSYINQFPTEIPK